MIPYFPIYFTPSSYRMMLVTCQWEVYQSALSPLQTWFRCSLHKCLEKRFQIRDSLRLMKIIQQPRIPLYVMETTTKEFISIFVLPCRPFYELSLTSHLHSR